MAQQGTLRVTNYREFQRVVAKSDKALKREARAAFRKVGDVVKADVRERLVGIDGKTAAGYRTLVRQRGISVEQSLRKTTGLRPDFSVLQKTRALDPALAANEHRIVHEFEHALDEVADIFNRQNGRPL